MLESCDEKSKSCKIHFELLFPPMLYQTPEPQVLSTGTIIYPSKSNTFNSRILTFDSDYTPEIFTEATIFTIGLKNVTFEDIRKIASRIHPRRNVKLELIKTHTVMPNYHSNLKCMFELNCCDEFRKFSEEVSKKLHNIQNISEDEKDRMHFYIIYLMQAILSRGSPVKDALLADRDAIRWKNLKNQIILSLDISSKIQAMTSALVKLLHLIDKRERIVNFASTLHTIFEQCLAMNDTLDLTDEEREKGIVLVGKLLITPTRILLMAPEKIVGNRVLRMYNQNENTLFRFVVRDDDYEKCRMNKMGPKILRDTIDKAFLNGIWIAGREFLFIGSSNSQIRDSGGYLLERRNKDVAFFRKQLGSFENLGSVTRYFTRHGQCYTNSFKSEALLVKQSEIQLIEDVKRNGYTFTDGIGMISQKLGDQIAFEYFGRDAIFTTPSAFQFRLSGYKGMLAINPLIDRGNSINTNEQLHLILRKSQLKFDESRPRETYSLEIVKHSGRRKATLNKPFILILDQNSMKQSIESNRRIRSRIMNLFDMEMRELVGSLIDDEIAAKILNNQQAPIGYDFLRNSGFSLIDDNFFQSLLKANIKESMNRIIHKFQIPIPMSLGRSMLGVVDETNTLEYGQVFIQYSAEEISPLLSRSKQIIKGKVMISKNPMSARGDVRIFEAIDIPQLHHHIDVVVFPQKGPRPHPNEMAGADLDGDEFNVIWDSELMLERNEAASDYMSEKPRQKPINSSTLTEDIAEYIYNYTSQNNIGIIGANHLIAADQFGFDSEVAQNLAKKFNKAVKYLKCGVPPEPLLDKWKDDLTPELRERNSNFGTADVFRPTYQSPSILGNISKYTRMLEPIVKDISFKIKTDDIVLDPSIIQLVGNNSMEESVRTLLQAYNYELKGLMDIYGISTEAEIFSGCFGQVRNRAGQKESEDFSMFTSSHIIQLRMKSLFKKYREKFFEEFEGGWLINTELPTITDYFYPENYIGNVLNRRCTNASSLMKIKAALCYKLTYEEARKNPNIKLLSFTWIAYDILAVVQQESSKNGREQPTNSNKPIRSSIECLINFVGNNTDIQSPCKSLQIVKEQAPFGIEMIDLEDSGYGVDKVETILRYKFKLEDINIRKISVKDKNLRAKFIVTVRCSIETYWKLRDNLSFEWQIPKKFTKKAAAEIPRVITRKIFENTSDYERVNQLIDPT